MTIECGDRIEGTDIGVGTKSNILPLSAFPFLGISGPLSVCESIDFASLIPCC